MVTIILIVKNKIKDYSLILEKRYIKYIKQKNYDTLRLNTRLYDEIK